MIALRRWILGLGLAALAGLALFFMLHEERRSEVLELEHAALQDALRSAERLRMERERHAEKVRSVMALRDAAKAAGLAPENWLINYLELDTGDEISRRLETDPTLVALRERREQLDSEYQQRIQSISAAAPGQGRQQFSQQERAEHSVRIRELDQRIRQREDEVELASRYDAARLGRLLTLLANPSEYLGRTAAGPNVPVFSPGSLVVERTLDNSFTVRLNGAFLVPRP